MSTGQDGTLPVISSPPPEVLYDPFPHYKALRDLGPVVYLTKYGLYGLFRYDLVRAALRDWQTFSSAPGIAFNAPVNDQIKGQSILAMDPPQHTAVRKVFDDALKPKFIRRAAGDIEQRAAELVDEVVARGSSTASGTSLAGCRSIS